MDIFLKAMVVTITCTVIILWLPSMVWEMWIQAGMVTVYVMGMVTAVIIHYLLREVE